MNRTAEREAWTAFVTGETPKKNKYGAKRKGKYASAHEASEAQKLHALERAGKIEDLREQVSFVLVQGRNGVSSVTYIADFTFIEDGMPVVADAKGCKTAVYKLKKRMMYLLCGIEIREL